MAATAPTSAREALDKLGLGEKTDAPFITDLERQSPIWAKIKKIMELRIEELHHRLESDKPEMKTVKLRGRIAECKRILSLDQPRLKLDNYDDRD